MMETPVEPRLTAALILVLAIFATACAHVGQQEFDAEIAALRSELDERGQEMDRGTAAQMAELSARLDRLGSALTDLEVDFDVTVERLETAIRFDVPVYFDFDQDNLRPQDLPVLARFGDVVTAYLPGRPAYRRGLHGPCRVPRVQHRSWAAACRGRPPLSRRNRRLLA